MAMMVMDGYMFESKFYGPQGLDRAVTAKITNITTQKAISHRFNQKGANNLALAFKWFMDFRQRPRDKREV